MYVEGDSRGDRGNIARLISYPQSILKESQCLSFHYRLHGPDTGKNNYFSYAGWNLSQEKYEDCLFRNGSVMAIMQFQSFNNHCD